MKNNNVINLGIIGILLLIVFASGCISSSTNETKTFSDGVMSFNYPGYFNSQKLQKLIVHHFR